LDSVDPGQDFDDIRSRIDALREQFEGEDEQNSTNYKASVNDSKSNVNLKSMDSMNFTGILSGNEDKTKIMRSNIDLRHLDENTVDEMLGSSNAFENTSPISSRIHSESSEIINSAYPRKNMVRQSYSNLETKVSSLETRVGSMIKNEAQLKGEISRLTIEKDGFKKMLENNEFFNELTNSISRISTSLLTKNSIEDVKFNHQIILKNLIDDSMKKKMQGLERKLSYALHQKAEIKDRFLEELNRSNVTYSYTFKYINLVREAIQLYNSRDHSGLQEKLGKIHPDVPSDSERVLINSDLTADNFEFLQKDKANLYHEMSIKEKLFNVEGLEQTLEEKELTIKKLNERLSSMSPSQKGKMKGRKSFDSFQKSRSFKNKNSQNAKGVSIELCTKDSYRYTDSQQSDTQDMSSYRMLLNRDFTNEQAN
jgi:hypothetical protein